MTSHQGDQALLGSDSVANLLRIGSLLLIALGLFAMAAGGLAVYLNLSAQLELERADRAATQEADRIAAALSDIQTSLRDASVVDAARAGPDTGNDDLRRALRERGVVNILDVRILPARIEALAAGGDRDLGFATSEVVMEAIRNDRAEIRVLEPGTPAESLVFAQRMPGESGILLLRLTSNVVTSLLQIDPALDFAALAQRSRQGPMVLRAGGRPSSGAVREVPIDGSSLLVQWRRAVVSAPLDNRAAVIVGCTGVITLMIGLLLRRRTRLAYLLGHKSRKRASEPAERRAGETPQPPPRKTTSRQAQSTLVLGPDGREPVEATTPASGSADDEDGDEESTLMSPPPDLPEWLREDDDDFLDELAPDDDGTGSGAPVPDAPIAHDGDDNDDDLLEDIDDYQGVDPAMFTEEGIRGTIGDSLDVSEMVILGQAVGSEAAERGLRRLCVAHDGRKRAADLLDGLIQGLCVSGIDVVDYRAAPAPVAWFEAMRMQQAGAVLVTGGDRPADVGGLEVVLDGHWFTPADNKALLERIRAQTFANGAGERSEGDEGARYREQIAASWHLQRPLKVVLDCDNATVGGLAPALLEAIGAEVVPLNADDDSTTGETADLSDADRLQDLKLCVANFEADLGIAFDRTAGRLRVVGADGTAVACGRITALLAGDLAEQASEPPTVIVDDSLEIELAEAARAGGWETATCNGDAAALQHAMRESGAALGGHADGAICTAHNWHGLPDALHATAWLLALLAADTSSSEGILRSPDAGSDADD